MTDAPDLWTAVVDAYDDNGLISLTNIRDRSATSINTSVGQTAAQAVIDLWPAYAQEAYDSTSALHVEVAIMGVIAILWRRGGSAASIARVRWDEVFSEEGLVAKVRGTGARAHPAPNTNSGVTQKAERTSSGQRYRGWSDRESLPRGIMPRRTVAED
jgi:hypothetical protein